MPAPLISPKDVAHLHDCFRRVLALLPAEVQATHSGGYYTRYHMNLSHRYYTMEGVVIGSVYAEKEVKGRTYSAEKPLRLSMCPGHVSSYQSRDEANGKWAGAIRLNDDDDIDSFSGLTWKGDEAMMLLFRVEQGRMTAREAYEIAKISENDLYDKLMDVVPALSQTTTTHC